MNWKEVLTPSKAEVIANVIISLLISLLRPIYWGYAGGSPYTTRMTQLIYGDKLTIIPGLILDFIIAAIILYVVFRVLTYSVYLITKKSKPI